ncbi:MAG: D-alanyl-D-alanine carboxypeptidase [Armatimonadetes bacterium]|nr:D-alanyl-D-alanine carboxypeptidase [Armatimonadota bacterium]
MKRITALLAAFALATPALAKPPAKITDPLKLPADKAQSLVNTSKIVGFYDPANLQRDPVVSAKAVCLMDAATGEIVYEKNADLPLYPASTTKIMTGLLLAEYTKPDDIITCLDPKIRDVEPSSLHVQAWEKFSSEDLLVGTLLRSGNDGCVLIAQHVSGSVRNFADLMNERAVTVGATNTHFTNPHGLPDTKHITTAHDLAVMTRAALQNERFAAAVRTPRRVIKRSKSKDVVVASKASKFYKAFPGADGVKTGYTRAARHCFVGSATRGGRQLIGVVLSAASNASGETATVLGWGFRRFPTIVAAKADESAAPVAVGGGVSPVVPTVAAANLVTFSDAVNPAPVVQTVAEPIADLTAPITKGQIVGRLVARVDGVERGSVPLLAGEDVAAAPLSAMARKTGAAFAGIAKNVWLGMGAGAVCLIGLAYYGTTTTTSARRRRNRVAPQSGGIHHGGARPGERRTGHGAGNQR